MSLFALLGLSSAICAAIMLGLWGLGVRHRNFSYVDIGWSANFAVIAIVYALLGGGDPWRRAAICLMYGVWSARLALYLMRRIVGQPEEGRYVTLRSEWGAGGNPNLKFLAFFEFQALLNVVLSIPMLLAVMDRAGLGRVCDLVAVLIWLIALGGESLADAQLARFKRQPQHQGKVCDVGLWGVSRHPNYFFEWLIWVAYALFAFGAPYGWVAVVMPLLMLHFLINVTGVKATEAQALASKGDAYRRYQRRVSAFVPWFPKQTVDGAS